MKGIVVDASLTLSWCFPDEQTELSINVLNRLKAGEHALVPAFWCVEVLNSLLMGEKRGRIAPHQTQAFLADLRLLDPLLDLALRHAVSACEPGWSTSRSRAGLGNNLRLTGEVSPVTQLPL